MGVYGDLLVFDPTRDSHFWLSLSLNQLETQANGGLTTLSSDSEKSTTSSAALNRERIGELLAEEGLTRWGIAKLERPFSFALYQTWLENGYHGNMRYLERHAAQKADPTLLMKRARSAIVVTANYVPHPEPVENWPLHAGGPKVAAYARGRDYHHWLKARLERVMSQLRSLAPEEEFQIHSDSSPVLERDLAARAGLGWIGKNTCLLSRDSGSLFLVAEIYTSLDFACAELKVTDHCGTCTRCLDACPTGALVGPRELDARLCISYLTIESRLPAPEALREKIGTWLFGCDICQTVCPWNLKFHGPDTVSRLDPATERSVLIEDLRWILTTSNRQLDRTFQGTPLARAGGLGLKRNALVVAGNQRLSELKGEILGLADDTKLSELSAWALRSISRE